MKRIWFAGMLALFLSETGKAGETAVLTLGAYTTPREAYRRIIPLFEARWKERTGKTVKVRESYLGSGAQSRAVAGGFEADVVSLSLASDIDRLRKAGLITHDWRQKPHGGVVTTSVVAFAVRRGNPRGIRDWSDLLQPGLEILTPNPKTSGGAQWNFLAIYGAAYRGRVAGFERGEEGATRFVRAVLRQVAVMDKGARESITNFERGLGEVALTYENEVLLARKAGLDNELIVPSSTIRIENPAAVVDVHADKHGVRAEAEAFLEFHWSLEAQRIFAEEGYRPVVDAAAAEYADKFAQPPDVWTVADWGGWDRVTPEFFGPGGIYDRVLQGVSAAR